MIKSASIKTVSCKEKKAFFKYFWSFYGPKGRCNNTFTSVHHPDYLETFMLEVFTRKHEAWGGGDSFDRELFRDFILHHEEGHKLDKLEHGKYLRAKKIS